MLNRLNEIEKRYDELSELLANPEVIANQAEYQK